MTDRVLEVDDYPGLTSAAGSGCLRLGRGDLVWVRGDSGAGKTRFLRRLIDLDPEPRGSIRLRGRPIAAIGCSELRRRVGYLAQDPVRFPGTGRQLLERVRALRGNAARCAPWTDVERRLDELDVAGLADRPMREYSGGENRRFALVALLQLGPDVLLLDEPTAGLDERRARAVDDLVAGERAAGTAVLRVVHGTTPAGDGVAWIGPP